MSKVPAADEWPIYNCHIHTFTRTHTPKNFIKFVLADPKTGKINWLKFLAYLGLMFLCLTAIYILANYILILSTHLDGINLPAYAFLLFFEGLLVIPVVVLAFMLAALILTLLAQAAVDTLIRLVSWLRPGGNSAGLQLAKRAMQQGQKMVLHPNLLVDMLTWVNPTTSNDIFERIARFLRMSAQPSQQAVFTAIKKQYPSKTTKFVVLPMDMTFMEMGRLGTSIDDQHAELLKLAKAEENEGQIIPFYAADPRQPDIVKKVEQNLARGKFEGIKIYPNLGYPPDPPRLLDIYRLCIQGDFPVLTHCSPGGVSQYGLSRQTRREYSRPDAYKRVLDQKEFRTLKLCLAHFGGAEEWARRLNREAGIRKEKSEGITEEPWVKTISDMIASGDYPNLYTDISYTAFTPQVADLYIDLIDYLKVLLANPRVRRRVLFGSDYYMVEQEKMSEKEASVLLRSRLGEDLYKQIALTNPEEFLCISPTWETRQKRAQGNKPIKAV